jgi:hypothetical protein
MRIVRWVWFHVLRFLDEVLPGWSMPASRSHPERQGTDAYVSAESLNYWLTDERCRRSRD